MNWQIVINIIVFLWLAKLSLKMNEDENVIMNIIDILDVLQSYIPHKKDK